MPRVFDASSARRNDTRTRKASVRSVCAAYAAVVGVGKVVLSPQAVAARARSVLGVVHVMRAG